MVGFCVKQETERERVSIRAAAKLADIEIKRGTAFVSGFLTCKS